MGKCPLVPDSPDHYPTGCASFPCYLMHPVKRLGQICDVSAQILTITNYNINKL